MMMLRLWGRVRPLSKSKERALRRDLERLEARMAPGCMLDVFGVIALGNVANTTGSIATESADGMDRTSSGDRLRHRAPIRATTFGTFPVSRTENTSVAVRQQQRVDAVHREEMMTTRKELAGDLETLDSPWSYFGHDRGLQQLIMPGHQSAGSLDIVGNAGRAAAISVIGSSRPDHENVVPGRGAAPLRDVQQQGESTRMLRAAVPTSSEANVEDPRIPRGLPQVDDADRVQSLNPYAITYGGTETEPNTGVVKSPAEYDPMRGVLFSYTSYASIVTDMVKELTEDPTKDDIAYVVVSSASQQTTAATSFANAGADLSKVQFFIQPSNSVWIRDYGPHFVTVDDSLAIVDSHYYPNRPVDNFMPTMLGDENFNLPTYDMGLYYSGGNFQPGPNGTAFVSSLVTYHNTTTDGFNESLISELYHRYQGIDTLHILPQLPFSVDGTGHIDMWMYLIDEDTVVISEFLPGSNSTAIQITNNAVGYMEDLGFEVHRLPGWNAGSTHYTYTNAFRVNDRIFVPVYGTALKPGGNSSYNDEDAAAMAVWQAAAGPNVEIIPIQSNQIIPAAGAIHCIVMQVPRYTASVPAANVISPAAGEVVSANSQYTIEWSAIDTNNVDPAEIGIYVSYGGDAYRHIATTTDTGSYQWTVDDRLAATTSATIKLVVKSSDNDQVEVFSDPFTITRGSVTTYDFSSGAGVNKFAYGSQTSSWANINGTVSPVGTPLTTSNYNAIATSNATGGDTDTNRYIAPVPSPVSNESTHVFSFQVTEAIQSVAQIDVLWEGYADFCTQVELYVWDLVAQNWGDAAGLTGNNRYMDSWAGNADGYLTGSIRSDFSRYVNGSGVIQFLVYADRTGTNPDSQHNAGQGIETFHDYMSVTVKQHPVGMANPFI